MIIDHTFFDRVFSYFLYHLGHEKIVELLLQKGAVLNALNKNKRTPFQLALQYGKELFPWVY